MTAEPKNNAVRLSEMLARYDRMPFQDWLADLIEARPSREEYREWAKGAPHHHAAVMKVAGNLAGFADQKVVTHKRDLEDMSDLELREFLRQRRAEVLDHYEAVEVKRLAAIDVEAVPVPKDKT